METTVRSLWTLIHGMGFGGLYLLACSGAIVELWRRYAPAAVTPSELDEKFLATYLIAMVVLAWLAVLSGAYIVYPWYRAIPLAGTVNLSGYPQKLLMSNPATIGWHSIGMEWKEHVAWFAPISITMAAAVFLRYKRGLKDIPLLRNAVLCFVAASLLAAGIAGFFGAEIDDNAPVRGGATIHLMQGGR
ncbi:MAG TPA: hypothetical protein VFN62_00070 [Acidobacteriaceae bacterium]|nr:hypothetical protein [Acidobacteriaceae bacterium]